MFSWDKEREEKLRALVERGLTMTEIGRKLGVSKGTISGKMMRMKLKTKKVETPLPNVLSLPLARITKTPSLPHKPREIALKEPDRSRIKNLMALEKNDCRYPLDGGFYCAHDIREGKPYCPYHCNLCYVG